MKQDRRRQADRSPIQSHPNPVAIQLHHLPAGEDPQIPRRAALGIGQVEKLEDIQDGDMAPAVDGDQRQPDPSLLMENQQLVGRSLGRIEAGGPNRKQQTKQEAASQPRRRAGGPIIQWEKADHERN